MGKELGTVEQRVFDYIVAQELKPHDARILSVRSYVHFSNGSRLPIGYIPRWAAAVLVPFTVTDDCKQRFTVADHPLECLPVPPSVE